jgi:DNA-binding CsgD family transcriptional regulator
MQNKKEEIEPKSVILVGGSHFEKLGFKETIKKQFEITGFHFADSGELNYQLPVRAPPFDKQYNRVVVIIVESNEPEKIFQLKKMIVDFSHSAVILALRNKNILIQDPDWPDNVRGIVQWDQMCKKTAPILSLISEGLTIFDARLMDDEDVPSSKQRNGEILSRLTRREMQIAKELSEGTGNRDIADHLNISVNTVNTHVNSLIAKIDVSNRTQIAVWYVKFGST